MKSQIMRKLLIIPPIIIGLVVVVILVKSQDGPQQREKEEAARLVRVVEALEVELLPRAVGFGVAQPQQVWEAVAEVPGRIEDIHPDLKNGAILPEGTELFRIEQVEYGLAETRSGADVQQIEAQILELEQREANLRRSLGVEQKSLELSIKELERKRQLVASGAVAQSEMDQDEMAVLSQQTRVQDLRNSLNLIPSERQALEAQLLAAQSSHEEISLDLGRTVVTAPFDCRIAEVDVERSQFVQAGQVLFKADSIASTEVPAQFPLSSLIQIMPTDMDVSTTREFNMDLFREMLGLSAVVRLRLADDVVEWQARFSRMAEQLDPQTRTVGVYVVVDKSYQQAMPGKRPPLIRNMYCVVELRGKTRQQAVVIPRSGLHGDRVYILGQSGRLETRIVDTGYSNGNVVQVLSGVEPGEHVVVTDLMPAVEGMLLSGEPDLELQDMVLREAIGEAPVQ